MKNATPLPKILVIVGPTASGKTAFSITLAKMFNGEIISADSRQIYRGMDIGTAKPLCDNAKFKNQKSKLQSKIEKNGVYISERIPHHLIDIRNPDEDYTVAEYQRDAINTIRKILRRGKLPILVGGTGLYVKAVVENLDIPKVPAHPHLRRKLEQEIIKNNGLSLLFKRLVRLDLEAAYIVDQKNPRRVIRALEVALATGKPFTAQQRKRAPLFDAQIIGVKVPPTILKRRIETRVDEMLKNGLVEEVHRLYQKYGKMKSLDAIGYREIIEYLDGKIPFEETARQIKVHTWRYAKRQMTWFKNDKRVQWINPKRARDSIHADLIFQPSEE